MVPCQWGSNFHCEEISWLILMKGYVDMNFIFEWSTRYLTTLTLPVCWSLCCLWAHGWVTVSASLPWGRFCPYLGWRVTSSHLSVPLPLCSIIVTWLLKDNLGFCQLWLIKKATWTIWQVPTLEYEKKSLTFHSYVKWHGV